VCVRMWWWVGGWGGGGGGGGGWGVVWERITHKNFDACYFAGMLLKALCMLGTATLN
jgi:hypothetical protein